MATFNITIEEQLTKGLQRIEDAVENAVKTVTNASKQMSQSIDSVEDSTNAAANTQVRAAREQQRADRERLETIRLARELAQAELFMSQARQTNARAAQAQSKVESNLNRTRSGAAGAGGAGIAGGATRGSVTSGRTGVSFEDSEESLNQIRKQTSERVRLERQAQAEVSRVLQQGARAAQDIQRRNFAENRRLRQQDTQNNQKAANDRVDAIFQSDSQTRKIRDRARLEETRATRDREQEVKRLENSINTARRQIEVGLLEMFFTLHSLLNPITDIANAFANFTVENIKAAAETQKFASTLRQVSANSVEARATLDRLFEITVDLSAITTPGLLEFSSRLQNAGLAAMQAESVIVAVTKRMEEQGKGASSTSRVLEQFTQAINANLISMQDFRPILREYPSLYKDFSEALGVTITDLDSMRDAADSVGGATNAIVLALSHVATIAEGAQLDTVNRQMNEFRDRIFNVQRALGDVFLPQVVDLLKQGNRLLEWVNNLSDSFRVATSAFAIAGAGIFKFAQGAAQLAIIGIVVTQMQGAVLQINNMTQSLNNMTAATLGTSAAAATLPPHLVRVTRIVSGITRVLPLAISLMVALAFIIPIAAALWAKFTEQTRLAGQEAKDFASIISKIPESFSGGEAAIQAQVKQLEEYRLTLQATRDEVAAELEAQEDAFRRRAKLRRGTPQDPNRDESSRQRASRLRGEFGDEFNPFESAEFNLRSLTNTIKEASAGGQRLAVLNQQVEELGININELNTIANKELPIEERLFSLVRAIERTRVELKAARFDEVFQVQGAADRVRRLEVRLGSLQGAFTQFQVVDEAADNISNFAAELITVDFVLRRLEARLRDFKAGDIVDEFGAFDTAGVTSTTNELIANLEKEAQLKRDLATQEEDDAKQLALDILQIDEQLAFDIENITRQSAQVIDDVHEEASNKRVGRITKFLAFEQAGYEARIQAEEKWQEFVESIEIKANEGRRQRRLKDAADAFRSRANETELVLMGVEAYALLDARVQEFYRNAVPGSVNYIEIQTLVRRKVDETTKSVEDLTTQLENQISVYEAFRRTTDETERFRFQTPEGERGITRDEPTTPLDPDDITGQFGQILELSQRIQKEAEQVIRANNAVVRSFSRGVSRSLSDFVFEGKETFAEFIKEFAKTSFRVIVQARIEAEIRKRISDNLTAHQIANINRVAASQISAGATASSFSGSQIAGLSPIASLATGGIGTLALVGLTIAPFLVRAIKDGFTDTKVEMDGREVGKVTAKNLRRLNRSGEVRLT